MGIKKKEDILCRLFTRSSRPPAIRESVETWNSFRQTELVSRAARKTPKEIQRKRRTDGRGRDRPRSGRGSEGAKVTEARAKHWKMDRQGKGESREDEKKTARGWANGLLAK